MHRKQESGQTIVLMAIALVGLLVSTGLAVDGAMLMVRKAQLDRAVDAAALAGVVKVGNATSLTDMAPVHAEGQIIMAANGIPVANPSTCAEPRDWNLYDYCGQASLGAVPGSVRYHVEAEWHSKTYFVSLVGITQIPIISEATAEYLTLVDIYASDTTERGLLNLSNQSVWGPGRSRSEGDPFSAANNNPDWKELTGAYTYRIRVPSEEKYPFNKVRVELFDPDTYNVKYGAADTGAGAKPVYRTNGTYTTKVCPDPTNRPWNACIVTTRANPTDAPEPNDNWFFRMDEIRWTNSGAAACAYNAVTCPNGLWYDSWEMFYPEKLPVHTMFRLYYLKQHPDGTLNEVDLAYYVSGADSHTDMMWVAPGAPAEERMPAFDGTDRGDVFSELGITVTPPLTSPAEPATTTENCEEYRSSHYGASSKNTSSISGGVQTGNYRYFTLANECSGDGNFIVDLETETPGIYTDPSTGIRDIYMQVRTLDAYSENGFGFWAGPTRTEGGSNYVVPAEINARQTYIVAKEQQGHELHLSQGVTVFGIGYLPMNTMFTSQQDNPATPAIEPSIPSDIPLTYLGPEFAGRKIKINIFDPDTPGTMGPITFHFDTLHDDDWSMCFKSHPTTNNCVGKGRLLGNEVLPIPLNNAWASGQFTIPSDSDSLKVPFYGGRLYARYFTGQGDTFVWKITTEGRPYLVK